MKRIMMALALLTAPSPAFAGDCAEQLNIEGVFVRNAADFDAMMELSNCRNGTYDVTIRTREGVPESSNERFWVFRGIVEVEGRAGRFHEEDGECALIVKFDNGSAIVTPPPGQTGTTAQCQGYELAGTYTASSMGMSDEDGLAP